MDNPSVADPCDTAGLFRRHRGIVESTPGLQQVYAWQTIHAGFAHDCISEIPQRL